MEKLIKQFEEARKELLDAISKFPKEKRAEKLFGEWDLKDVTAHFTAWDIFFTTCVKLLKAKKDVPYWGSINDFNKVEVEKQKSWKWEKVYAELEKSGETFIKELKALSKDLHDKPLWKGKSYTPLKLLSVNTHHYLKAQLVEIKKHIT